MALHAAAFAVEQDRSFGSSVHSAVHGAGDRRGHRHEHDLGAFAYHAHDAVAVFFAEVVDVQSGGFHDAQPEQAEQADQREVVAVRGMLRDAQHCLELKMAQPERR
jgi:hypothetical protein